jgi:cytochrome P450
LYYNPRLAPALDILDDFISPLVDKARFQQVHDSKNFLDTLTEFTDNPKILRDQLVNILLAGRDTTAATLSFLFYELAYQPAVYKQLREEVLQTLGIHGEPTYANLKSMKFLQNCLNETLRLYPIVPHNGRTALVDTTLPLGGGPEGKDVYPFCIPL